MFKEIQPESFSAREERILKFWNENAVFQASLKQREKSTAFTFYDGPPFATGLPHYGHLLAGTIKDVVPRYKTMKGFYVSRRFGWDCHGLPVEQEIEKGFDLSGAKSIEAFGIGRFNEECRKIVLRYTEEWKQVVSRMGRWVDFDQTYKTMDLNFMESVWWVFKQLFEKGLVYEGYKVMPFSAKLGTPLSNFEAGENYQEIDDPALTVAFPLIDDPKTSILIWTTTPWTLVSNLAVMAGPEIDYVKIADNKSGKQYIVAASRLATLYKTEAEYTILDRFKGKDLEGKTYQPPFDYFLSKREGGAFRVILDQNVSLDEGTGLVHSAPAFGEVDFYACQKAGIAPVCPVDNNGKFTAEIPEHQGLFVKDADKDIIKRLKDKGLVFHHGMLRHRYPFCWRSDTPLIYKAVTTWFVAVEKIKEKLLKANQQIHWTPGYLKDGRFGKWLEGARDWAISRNRYWGTPIPIFKSEDGDLHVVGSIEELEKLTGKKIDDLHRHFIDDLSFQLNGKTYRRIPEVFDCWFESGSMPYAQNHYPFEKQEQFDAQFPADFIAEGIDQTRGWFYTLTVLAAALFDKPAFKNVIVNGIILAKDGSKMSKRLKNYPDPMEVVGRHGADAVRLYMLHSPAVKGDDLCFTEEGVELVMRQVLIPLWNAYSFFLTYARIYKWTPQEDAPSSTLIDRWVTTKLNKLIHDVEQGMDAYDLSQAVEPFVGFVDELTNWYIRRSRRRFWSEEDSQDRREAFATLYNVLVQLTKVAAPFVPYISDAIYQNLRKDTDPASVHLCDYPQYHKELRDVRLEKGMEAIQRIVSLGHAMRKEHKVKVRQPLPMAEIACASEDLLDFLMSQKHLIEDELNVKEIRFHKTDEQFVTLQAKPNFRVLGKKVGGKMQAVQALIQNFTHVELEKLMNSQNVELTLEGQTIVLTPEDVEVKRIVREGLIASTDQGLTIALDTTLSEPLILEGLAREIVNKVNSMRRESKLDVSDRIVLKMDTTSKVREAFNLHADWIQKEILAVQVEMGNCSGEEWDLNGEPAKIEIHKAR